MKKAENNCFYDVNRKNMLISLKIWILKAITGSVSFQMITELFLLSFCLKENKLDGDDKKCQD